MTTFNVSFQQLATLARQYIDRATLPADDQTQALLSGVKQFLDGVAAGTYVVAQAEKKPEAKEAAAKPEKKAPVAAPLES